MYSYDTTNWGTVFHNVFTTDTMSQLMQIAQERYELENRLREEAASYVSESITIDGVPLMSLMEIPEISFTLDEDTVMNWFNEIESSQLDL